MIREKRVKTTLWISVPFNFLAAYAVLLPHSAVGQWLGLPASVPLLYTVILAFFIATFGLVYAWQANSVHINRPVLAISAMAKSGVFFLVLGLWLVNEAAAVTILFTTGDLVFASVWGLWLWSLRNSRDPARESG